MSSSIDHLLQVPSKVAAPSTPSTSVPSEADAQSVCKTATDSCSESSDDHFMSFEPFLAWQHEQGTPVGDPVRCAALAYRFCLGLGIVYFPACCVVLTAVRMLAACSYDIADVEVVFAAGLYALRNSRSAEMLARMGSREKVLVAILHLYAAHSVVFDEFVHFKIWHQWMLAPFCNLSTASAAFRRVCALRRWRFSFSDEELGPVLEELRQDPVQPAHLDLEVYGQCFQIDSHTAVVSY